MKLKTTLRIITPFAMLGVFLLMAVLIEDKDTVLMLSPLVIIVLVILLYLLQEEIIKCSKCGKKIIATIKSCPSCSYSITEEEIKKQKKSCNVIVYTIWLIMGILLLLMGTCEHDPKMGTIGIILLPVGLIGLLGGFIPKGDELK